MADRRFGRRLRRLLSLSGGRRRALVEALFIVPAAAALLRVFGYGRLRGWMARAGGPAPADADARARELAWCVSVAARRGLGRPACLARSMALWWMLRRAGIDSELQIGVRKAESAQGIEAHAWIERGGAVLNDNPAVKARYVAFQTGPAELPRAAWN